MMFKIVKRLLFLVFFKGFGEFFIYK
jgi:hypothetical protein